MADMWTFGPPKDDSETYSDGTEVPHRYQAVFLNGVEVGYIEIHMHRRRGDDKVTDVSFGITACTYGPAPGGS